MARYQGCIGVVELLNDPDFCNFIDAQLEDVLSLPVEAILLKYDAFQQENTAPN